MAKKSHPCTEPRVQRLRDGSYPKGYVAERLSWHGALCFLSADAKNSNFMIYRHRYFHLDVEGRKVFDENGKELRLTGNAYRMLVFLCKNRHANLTDIGEYLDWAKDYNENHIRQYRYKINTIIGYDVIEYKNGVYSLVGNMEEAADLDIGERNTDLLHDHYVELRRKEVNSMEENNTTKWYQLWWVWVAITFFVIVGIVIVSKNYIPATQTQNSFLEATDSEKTNTSCLIKGNISSGGKKIYHLPGGRYYDVTVIDKSKGERWFCTEAEATAAGWRKSKL